MLRLACTITALLILAGCGSDDRDRSFRYDDDDDRKARNVRHHDNDRDDDDNRNRHNRDGDDRYQPVDRDDRDDDDDRYRSRQRSSDDRIRPTPPPPAEPYREDPQPTAVAPSADHVFLYDVTQANLAEIELGQAAARNAASDDVRRFGQRMIENHSESQDEVARLIRDTGAEPIDLLDAHHRAIVSRLASMDGYELDREYVAMTVEDHGGMIAKFEAQAAHGADPEIREFARKSLPTLRKHLRMAQDLQRNDELTRRP